MGERVATLQRIFALSRGFRREDEFDVSRRMLEAPGSGAAAGKSLRPHLEQVVDEYYEIMGWDESGRPRPDTLRRLGLEDTWRRAEAG